MSKRITSVSLDEALEELPYQEKQLETIEERWKGRKVVSAFAGGGYNHARYYKKQEKVWLKRRIVSLEKRITKLKS